MTQKNKLTYIDIFSGCGGLSLGLHNTGLWEGLFAVEKNEDAFETLKYNLIERKQHFSFPKWLEEKNYDINDLLKNKELSSLRGKVSLVAGGPPCQGFSLAGRRNMNDIRNSLVYSYIKFIDIVQPKVIFFENVKGFDTPFKKGDKKVNYADIVIEELDKIGYKNIVKKIVNFSEYGVPQSRKRFILVATKDKRALKFFNFLEDNKEEVLKSKGLNNNCSLVNAISDLNKSYGIEKSKKYPNFFMGNYGPVSSDYQKYMRKGIVSVSPSSHRFPNHKKETEDKFKVIINEKLSSSEIRNKFNTKKSSTRLLEPNLPSPTLTTLPDDLIHYSEPRILTVREYARIQSFPDNYVFRGKYTTGGELRKIQVPRYTQIGNAIPPLFGEQAGLAIYKLLTDR